MTEISTNIRATAVSAARLEKSIKKTFWSANAFVFVLSAVVITGWITNNGWMKGIVPGWTPMRILVAVSFMVAVSALSVLFLKRPEPVKKSLPLISAIFLISVSLLTSFSWIYLKSTGHEVPFSELPFFRFLFLPGVRMPLMGSVFFFFTGINLILLIPDRPLLSNMAHLICFILSVAGYMIPASYILDVHSFKELFLNSLAPAAGISFCALSVAVFTLRSDTWLMKVFTSTGSGGVMARRMLLWLVILPLVIGWLRINGERTGLFDSELGVFLVAITYTFCFILLLWLIARSLNRIDKTRQLAVDALEKSYSTLETMVQKRTEELVDLNRKLENEVKERRTAQELVSTEQQRMNNLLEMMPAYVILLTPDYHVSYSNRTFRENFGVSNGKRCFEFLFNRTEPCEICETYKVLKENKPQRWEWEGPNKRTYSIHDFPYTDSDGSPLIMEMGIDVTDLKKAEASLVALNTGLEQKVNERIAELRILNERLHILSETSAQLLASENPQELINSLCMQVMKYLDCHVFFNYLSHPETGNLHLNSYSGIPPETAKKIEWLEYGVAVCGCVAKEGKRIVAENIPESDDPRTNLVKSFGVMAYACHPLLSHDSVMGTLSFGSCTRTSFSDNDLSMMKTVADQVAISLTRVKDRESLRKSEERYRSLMELSPDACFVCRDETIVLINSAAINLLGANGADEILGKTPYDIFDSSSHASIKERFELIKKGRKTSLTNEQIIRMDGVIRNVEVVSAVSVDPDGTAIQVIINDITERLEAEKELFETKNYLENLTDNANAPIIVWDQENRIRLFNHAFERLTGYTSEEVEGRKLDLLFPKASVKESMKMIRNAIVKNWETIEIPILTRDGRIRTVLWNSAKVYDNNKKTFSTIAQGNDITERIEAEKARKESKEKLDIALENGQIGVWEYDPLTKKFIVDERMEQMLGFAPGTFESSLDALEKRIHEEDLPHVRSAFANSVSKGTPLETVYRIKHSNGDINYINTKALVEKVNGEAVRLSGVSFDITAMKKGAEKALFSLNEELLRSNRELEQFAYVASHDLQEPLRMVSSFTQLLSYRYGNKLDKDAHEFIQYAVEGAVRMQILINDLLDYSRISTRAKKFVPVDMHNILGQVINNLSIKIQEKNALVTNDELPVVVADESQMVQLFQNLIGNCLKFCNESPRIHISSREEKDSFLFAVRDNGIGIESQYFTKIFQIFQRLHPKDEYGGTGIGLAICKRIVENHGGKIWVESKPGKGSLFLFTLAKK